MTAGPLDHLVTELGELLEEVQAALPETKVDTTVPQQTGDLDHDCAVLMTEINALREFLTERTRPKPRVFRRREIRPRMPRPSKEN
jgi:hypothetical protein